MLRRGVRCLSSVVKRPKPLSKGDVTKSDSEKEVGSIKPQKITKREAELARDATVSNVEVIPESSAEFGGRRAVIWEEDSSDSDEEGVVDDPYRVDIDQHTREMFSGDFKWSEDGEEEELDGVLGDRERLLRKVSLEGRERGRKLSRTAKELLKEQSESEKRELLRERLILEHRRRDEANNGGVERDVLLLESGGSVVGRTKGRKRRRRKGKRKDDFLVVREEGISFGGGRKENEVAPLSVPLATGEIVMKDASMHWVEVSSTRQVPMTLPECMEGYRWHYFEEVKSVVPVPLEGWGVQSGWGDVAGCRVFSGGVTLRGWEEGVVPRVPVGMWVNVYLDVLEQKELFDVRSNQSIAEWFTAYAIRRADKFQKPHFRPDILDSWRHELVPNATIEAFGIEFSMPWNDIQNTQDQGFQYHTNVIVNRDNKNVYEVTFKAPTHLWPHAWSQHGQFLVDNCYLNWDDMSQNKFI